MFYLVIGLPLLSCKIPPFSKFMQLLQEVGFGTDVVQLTTSR